MGDQFLQYHLVEKLFKLNSLGHILSTYKYENDRLNIAQIIYPLTRYGYNDLHKTIIDKFLISKKNNQSDSIKDDYIIYVERFFVDISNSVYSVLLLSIIKYIKQLKTHADRKLFIQKLRTVADEYIELKYSMCWKRATDILSRSTYDKQNKKNEIRFLYIHLLFRSYILDDDGDIQKYEYIENDSGLGSLSDDVLPLQWLFTSMPRLMKSKFGFKIWLPTEEEFEETNDWFDELTQKKII